MAALHLLPLGLRGVDSVLEEGIMEDEVGVWDLGRTDSVVASEEEVVLEGEGTLGRALFRKGSGVEESKYLMGLEEGEGVEDGGLVGVLGVAEGADIEKELMIPLYELDWFSRWGFSGRGVRRCI